MKALAKSPLASCIVVFAVSSCMDQPDPVSINPPEVTAAAEPGTATMAMAENVPVITDPFRHRLDLSFSVSSSSLVPGSPFTMTLLGTATSTISGGSVRVVMPTLAAMQYAGTGGRPDYGMGGGKFPTIASWTLPAMRAGQSFTRTVAAGAMANGYYQVVALIDARGPDKSPYITDRKFEQAWLSIADGGGSLTRSFDGSVFPVGAAPLPGPHRHRATAYTGRTTSSASEDAGNSGDDDVYVRVVYVDGDNSKKAVGAHVWATTVSEEDPEGSGHGYEERTVGPTGIVWFSCPGSGNMLVGAGDLPANSNVGGNTFAGYWDAHNNECGDTITVVGARRYYLPWIYLKEVVPEIESHLSVNRSRIYWRVDLDMDNAAHYDHSIDRIVFGSAYDRKFAVAHEFGHAVQEEKMGGIFQAEDACYDSKEREFSGPTGYKCAFQEGFASYVGGIAAPDDTSHDFEGGNVPADAGRVEAEYEVNVAGLFHDLIDDTTENGDYTDYPSNYVVAVYKTCEVRVTFLGIPRWDDRDDVSDYVWCLEEDVEEDVHADNFPGVTTPSDARDNAGRPTGWNADDIRRTWKKNVGV